jgi:hemerythrin-like metal-binding protein/diguanylate cyclase (GGDEF)-like protein
VANPSSTAGTPDSTQRACLEALAGAGLLALGAQGGDRLVHISAPLADLLGLPEVPAGASLLDFVAEADRARVRQALASRGDVALEFLAQRADGSLFEAELVGTRSTLPDGEATVFSLSDASARRYAAGELSYAALHDAASGLPNAALFRQRLRQAASLARRAGRRAAVLVAQFDGAPLDEALRAVCARLRKCLRDADTLARLGPRELGILLTQLGEREHAAVPAVRLAEALAEPIAIGGRSVRVAARFGIAAFPDDSADPDSLVDLARAASRQTAASAAERYAFAPLPQPDAAEPPAVIRWEQRFEVGIEVLDGQHRHLLELINRLAADLRAGRDFDPLLDSLKDLVRYTEHHFATEERLMDEVGAAAERHRAEHRRLEGSLARLTLRLDAEGVSESSRFLRDWLFRHIDEVDRPFAALLRSRGVS